MLLFQDFIGVSHPFPLLYRGGFFIEPGSIIVCNHVHPVMDILSLLKIGGLTRQAMCFMGYVRLQDKVVTVPARFVIGVQNAVHNLKNRSGVCWDTDLGTWIENRVCFLKLPWDNITNRPMKGCIDDVVRSAIPILESGCNVVGFPEGDFDYSYNLKQFRCGFFRIAKESGRKVFVLRILYRNTQSRQLISGKDFTTNCPIVAEVSLSGIIVPNSVTSAEDMSQIAKHMLTEK
jgi:1-acyl-sn-glycerol-3-phosphate acyltransferase